MRLTEKLAADIEEALESINAMRTGPSKWDDLLIKHEDLFERMSAYLNEETGMICVDYVCGRPLVFYGDCLGCAIDIEELKADLADEETQDNVFSEGNGSYELEVTVTPRETGEHGQTTVPAYFSYSVYEFQPQDEGDKFFTIEEEGPYEF